MTGWEIFIAVFIHLLVPLAGLSAYLLLVNKMRRQCSDAPVVSPFLVFAIYGGVLLLLLTSLFWYWSGMASLGSAFLLVVAPFIMLGVAMRLRAKKQISKYHRAVFYAAAFYPALVFPVLLLGIIWSL